MADKDEILETLEDYAQTYCAKDLTGLMAVFDDGSDISAIGTGSDELCQGPEQLRNLFQRNFDEATALQFEWHWRHVTQRGSSAAIATTLTLHLDISGERLSVPLRWAIALTKTEQGWKWLHRHASIAADGQEKGAAYPK